MKKLWTLTWVETKLFLREPAAFFFTLMFPVLLIVMFGLVFGNEPGAMFPGPFGYVDYSTPAMTALIIVSVALMGIPVQTATERERKVLRRFRVAPIRPSTYVGASVLVYYLMSLVGMVITIAVATALFGLRFGGSWIDVTVGFTLVAAAFFSAGYVIASVAATPRVAQVMGQILFFPMMFLSGAALPLQIMPPGLRSVAELLPMTHAVLLLQNLWFGQPWSESLSHVAVMLVTMTLGLLVSAKVFRWE